jgi:hypothetical protein
MKIPKLTALFEKTEEKLVFLGKGKAETMLAKGLTLFAGLNNPGIHEFLKKNGLPIPDKSVVLLADISDVPEKELEEVLHNHNSETFLKTIDEATGKKIPTFQITEEHLQKIVNNPTSNFEKTTEEFFSKDTPTPEKTAKAITKEPDIEMR